MAQATKIEWTDLSWNPTHGCSRVSTGCKICYAETLSLRRGFTAVPWTERNAAQNVMLKPHKLREPLSRAKPWDQPCRVFVNSMSDLFHKQIPDEYIAQVFAVMAAAPQHTFQILTKRPERMREWFAWEGKGINRCGTVRNQFDFNYAAKLPPMARLFDWPLPNVWLGVSIENRKWVGRADVLRQTPAAVRFISAEPLLGPLVYDCNQPAERPRGFNDALSDACWYDGDDCPELDLTSIDWLIVGGESGGGHRPFDPQWARDLRDATRCAGCLGRGWNSCTDPTCRGGCGEPPCAACGGARHNGTAFFLKQTGGARPGTALEDLPEDLRIREYPVAARP